MDAVKAGEQETLRALLNEGIDVNIAQVDGATALHWAAHRNDLTSTELLIGKGARPNAGQRLWRHCTLPGLHQRQILPSWRDYCRPEQIQTPLNGQEETVLMTCARTGNAAAVKALLTQGADPNAKETRWEQTALMWALAGNHPPAARTLMEHGANIQARSKAGFTPLMICCPAGRSGLGSGLAHSGSRDQCSHTATRQCAGRWQAEAVTKPSQSFCWRKGADPNSPDHRGVTPLHYAVPQGLSTTDGLKYDDFYRPVPPNLPKLVEALLAHGADPNAQITRSAPLGPEAPSAGVGMAAQTPLLLAALAADVKIIRILADNGADPLLGTYTPMSGADNDTSPLMAAAGESRYRWKGTLDRKIG